MPIKVKTYQLPPTPLIPNSPYPLLHFPSLLKSTVSSPTFKPTQILDLFASHGWQTQWIARYGPDIQSHYHSTTHECMAVIAGSGATIRFGVADAEDWAAGSLAPGDRGAGGEQGGVDVEVGLGDVFVIPAGVSHKTFLPRPECNELAFYQPEDMVRGRANVVTPEKEKERRKFFEEVPVTNNFMQIGAYPYGGVWDFKVGGEHEGKEREVWDVPMPKMDPVLGDNEEGLLGLWKGVV